jgi:hypothetical protein
MSWQNFKANSGILALMKGVKNPHDEIKGSNPSPGAYFEGIRGYYKSRLEQKLRQTGTRKHNFNNRQS